MFPLASTKPTFPSRWTRVRPLLKGSTLSYSAGISIFLSRSQNPHLSPCRQGMRAATFFALASFVLHPGQKVEPSGIVFPQLGHNTEYLLVRQRHSSFFLMVVSDGQTTTI